MCECGLFPILTQQQPSTAAAITLPAPFRRLRLGCISEIYHAVALQKGNTMAMLVGYMRTSQMMRTSGDVEGAIAESQE